MINRCAFAGTAVLIAVASACMCGVLRDGFAADEPADNLAAYYGFGRLELYKLQQRIGEHAGRRLEQRRQNRPDFDRQQQQPARYPAAASQAKPGNSPASRPAPAKINAIESDKRLEHKKIAVERELASLAVGDFNGDGRKDLAWFGVPDQLTIAYQSATGDWTNRKRVRLPDIAAGNVDHGGRRSERRRQRRRGRARQARYLHLVSAGRRRTGRSDPADEHGRKPGAGPDRRSRRRRPQRPVLPLEQRSGASVVRASADGRRAAGARIALRVAQAPRRDGGRNRRQAGAGDSGDRSRKPDGSRFTSCSRRPPSRENWPAS